MDKELVVRKGIACKDSVYACNFEFMINILHTTRTMPFATSLLPPAPCPYNKEFGRTARVSC